MSDDTDVTAYLAQHPRLIGALFFTVLLMTQGMGLVSAAAVISGP